MKSRYHCFALFLFFVVLSVAGIAQSPGIIVRPATGHVVTPLNPDGNAYSSKTTSGFATNDISESEIPFKIVPPAIIEPTGDLATGPSGGFTDIVKTVDGSGFYLFKDATNLYFRLRIGGIISGSKGYSILIDTDGKIGNSGPNADPNYIAPTNTSNGNPGFEYEVVFRTNFEVTVYNVDGTTSPTALTPAYGLNSHSQISVALSTDGGNPDYFYDWFVPLSAVGNPASIRLVATTVTSPTSALQGSRSDIYGIDDAANTNVASAWTTAVSAQPAISLTNFNSYTSSIGSTCTAAPTLSSPITTGSNIAVSGTWTRLDASKPSTATITLYKNDVPQTPTVSVTSGGNWSITVANIASGDVFYAKAQASGESMCLESNKVRAMGCSNQTPLTGLSITCASDRGFDGVIPVGAKVRIYSVSGTGYTLFSDDATTQYKVTYPTTTRWIYDGPITNSTDPCKGGSADVPVGAYAVTIQLPGQCESDYLNACVGGTATTTPVITQTALYTNSTIVSGTASAGNSVRLFINGKVAATTTAADGTYAFTSLSLYAGDVVSITAMGTSCVSASVTRTVNCFTTVATINTNNNGNLVVGASSISGKSSEPVGTTIRLYDNLNALIGTTTVQSGGAWSINTTVAAGKSYYVTQQNGTCAVSASSSSASAIASTTACATITGSYTEGSTSVTGGISTALTGTIRLFLDGVQIGSVDVSSATTWTISSFLYKLYPGGQLTVTAQATGSAESTGCPSASANIGCTSPTKPTITPESSNINVGNSVTYTIRNANNDTWYAVQDNMGKSFATSVYRQNANDFTITTNPINTAGTYELRITADKLTGCAATFAIASITANHVALPVHFVEVTVKSQGNKPQLTWQVADEQNVAFYSIEKSYDGSFFEEGGKTPYKSTTADINTYTFTDQAPATEELVYYRIKQVDKEGKYIYSKIVSLKLQAPSAMQLVPNPAYDKTEVQVVSNRPQSGWLQLVDPSGALVKKQVVTLKKGLNKISLEGLQQFGNGTYFVQVVLPDGTLYKKLLLQ